MSNSELKREIGFFSATILVVANMIGTGIFTTSGFIITDLGDPQTMLLCWLVGGIFALCGALCYGELGAMFPRTGGEYVFLRKSFGKGLGFLSGWISLIVGFSAPIAAAPIAFATYFFLALPASFSPEFTVPFLGVNILTISPIAIMAVAIIIIFSLIHYHSLFLGTRVQNGLTVFKIGLIVVFVVAGLCLGHGSTGNFSKGMVVTASFDKLLLYIGFTLSLFAMLTVVGMMVLRIREPDLIRNYKIFAYPVPPLLFILGNLWIIYFSIKSRPATSLFGLATVGLGILVYLYFGYKKKRNREI